MIGAVLIKTFFVQKRPHSPGQIILQSFHGFWYQPVCLKIFYFLLNPLWWPTIKLSFIFNAMHTIIFALFVKIFKILTFLLKNCSMQNQYYLPQPLANASYLQQWESMVFLTASGYFLHSCFPIKGSMIGFAGWLPVYAIWTDCKLLLFFITIKPR